MKAKKKPAAKKSSLKKASVRKIPKKKPANNKSQKNDIPPDIAEKELSCIVGVGASAGGLEALQGFIAGLTVPNNMAIIIIQHLSPSHKSIMGDLLAKHTRMNISEIKDGMKIQSNTVYLNPPDRDVSVMHSRLYLSDPLKSHGIRLPIDFFLRSLAEDQKDKAVSIILSGTGTDGTLGLKAVKGEGGMTMAQDQTQAKYDSMPRSAINTGMVDFIRPVEIMGEELDRYAKHPYIEEARRSTTPKQEYIVNVNKIFMLVRGATGHDFTHYKQNTTCRRIERRMAVHQISKIEDYYRLLREHPAEIEALFKDMLISVTSFFRDHEAFDVLENKIIPSMLERTKESDNIRIWVPGCATGEEAYSIAILIQEAMESMNKHANVQVFATDIDASAVDFARAGVYPDSIAADVSQKRLKRYFTNYENTYMVSKQVREMVVFAVQNLIKDPPFSRLDLVSCRNVLIYMDSVLQKKILPLFHYTLNPDGTLFLGTSESIGEFSDYFASVNTKWKIFRRKGTLMKKADKHHALRRYTPPFEKDRPHVKSAIANINIRSLAESLILDNYAPACVLLNDKFDIVYFQGTTDMYLSSPSGEPTFNVLKMAREEIRYKLSTMLHKAIKQKEDVSARNIKIHYGGYIKSVDLIVRPLPEYKAPPGMMMVVFEDSGPSEKQTGKTLKKKTAQASDVNPRIAALEQELQSSREHLKTMIEELETSNEELKSTNEELQSTNEELQSTNEEMETSKEELQSTNEELETVNSELQNRVDDLSRVNNDLNNLLSSTEIGTIFLDSDLNISRFTPPATKIYNLIPSDAGRPISDITSKSEYKNIVEDAKKVLDTLIIIEKDLSLDSGKIYHMNIIPYRTAENLIAGIVITFVDITTLMQKEEESRRLATVVRDSNDAICILGLDGSINTWNRGAEKMYGYTEEEALKMNITRIVPSDLKREALSVIKEIKTGHAVESFKTKRITKDGRILDVWLTITKLVDNAGNVTSVATTERDITSEEINIDSKM